MPDLTKCPWCAAGRKTSELGIVIGIRWTCGSQLQGLDPWQSKDCRLDALETLAAEQCGHSPESADGPLEAIRRELARLRAQNALLAHVLDCWRCQTGGLACGKRDKLAVALRDVSNAAAVKAATSPGGG